MNTLDDLFVKPSRTTSKTCTKKGGNQLYDRDTKRSKQMMVNKNTRRTHKYSHFDLE